MREDALAVKHLAYAYGSVCAMDDLSFQLPRGTFLAILGPNGAGKSTLMALLTRLLRPAAGEIAVYGHHLAHQPSRVMRHIGVVYQQSTLDLDLSVQQNLRYHGALQGMAPAAVKCGIDRELQRFALDDLRHRRIRHLNGGHRRRVELARALLHSPDILLLDEPTAGLDVQSRRELNRHVRCLCREAGVAVLWATHLIDELQAADRLLILHRGRCQASGVAEELLARHHVSDIANLFDRLTEAA